MYDNVEDADLLRPSWPSNGRGTVILTTRNPDIAHLFTNPETQLNIHPFPTEDGEAFLTSTIQHQRHSKLTAQEMKAIKDICKAVDCLPLALDLVGSYIRSCGISLIRFQETHPEFEQNLLFDGIAKLNASLYQNSIDRLWTIARVPTKYGLAAEANSRILIQMLSFLDASGAPLFLFERKSREHM